jgi:splicing factor U2AF 35 kDa subunit
LCAQINVCENQGEHLSGNVYVMFRFEEDAERALHALNNRWYSGRVIFAELSPVTDFREAACRQYGENTCDRGGFCNFMHVKRISPDLKRELYGNRALASEHARGGGGGGGGGGFGGGGGGGRRRDFSPPRGGQFRDHRR